MTSNQPDSERTLRTIDDLGAEAEHSQEEARAALEQAQINPAAFVRSVRDRIEPVLPPSRVRRDRADLVRNWALVALAASAAMFVVSFHFNYRAGIESQRQAARAQMISPLLPALASDDPEKRSIALVVARQVDPAFASQTETELARWEVNSQAQVRAYRNSAYASRILAGLQKLQLSRDPDDRKVAIWNDLLPVLQEARRNRNDFMDVALEYQRVLPLLRVRNPEVFLDSYWGELWILNILLESKIAPVVEAARQLAPDPALVQQIFDRNAAALPDHERQAFREAVAVYRKTLKTLQ